MIEEFKHGSWSLGPDSHRSNNDLSACWSGNLLLARPSITQITSRDGYVLAIDRVCLHWPYVQLLPLKHYPPAESYCSHHYPLPPTTVTRTVTQPTTTVVTVSKPARTVTSTPFATTSTVFTSTSIAYVYTTTVTATATSGTSIRTVYTGTEIDTVYTRTNIATEYTSTSTDYHITGTDTITTIVATLPSTTTTATVTAFTIKQETVTVSSGTVTAYTTIDTGLTRRHQQKHHDFREDLVLRLAACRRDVLQTACSCIEVHPPTHTVTATAKRTHTSYKTVCATRTVSVVGTVTTKQAFTSTISTASTTTTSIVDVSTVLDVETDTTSVESVSTLSTVLVTQVPTAATTTASVTSFSEVDVVFTTTVPTTSTYTVTVPLATSTISSALSYSRVYGPVDGCAYVLMESFLDQYSVDIPSGTSHTARAAICAAFCDRTPGCKTVGMNWFPACGANGESVYCIASANAWAGTSAMECGIGTGYNGCAIYQDGTVYEKSAITST
ncbi:uncharacterized protein TRIREDRAFT_111807 [Trichoderma reesei QM6a]|uniref:Predicted protein n=2 Tax=Hypocrea jecorina TaxID=51453 RepID=G0RVG7_HYPJQ|nr:uncharacterized protein TRIREDRAFT_111807 [Trichoderma reesei QM6a]EGR44801.1 predicted protein [Trichoderma reesei QM6a]ETR97688.1 hypothetical protein M419DRAFT_134213 [Trichoderma reesei RUT C-30]